MLMRRPPAEEATEALARGARLHDGRGSSEAEVAFCASSASSADSRSDPSCRLARPAWLMRLTRPAARDEQRRSPTAEGS